MTYQINMIRILMFFRQYLNKHCLRSINIKDRDNQNLPTMKGSQDDRIFLTSPRMYATRALLRALLCMARASRMQNSRTKDLLRNVKQCFTFKFWHTLFSFLSCIQTGDLLFACSFSEERTRQNINIKLKVCARYSLNVIQIAQMRLMIQPPKIVHVTGGECNKNVSGCFVWNKIACPHSGNTKCELTQNDRETVGFWSVLLENGGFTDEKKCTLFAVNEYYSL